MLKYSFVQLRWLSGLLKYKTDNNVPEDIKEELQECAKTISELDLKMQNIHNRLNKKRV